jgi:hypothetical protein
MKMYSYIWLVVGVVSFWLLLVYLTKVHDEVNPEKYQKFLNERIARYSDPKLTDIVDCTARTTGSLPPHQSPVL